MLEDDEEFVPFQIPRKSLTSEFEGKYRVYFRDGTSQDVAADSATTALEALEDAEQAQVMKVVNLVMAYRKTLKNNFLLPAEGSVPTRIAPDDDVPKNLGFYFFGDLAKEEQEGPKEPFEAMSLVEVAAVNQEGLDIPEATALEENDIAEGPVEAVAPAAADAPVAEDVGAATPVVEQAAPEPLPVGVATEAASTAEAESPAEIAAASEEEVPQETPPARPEKQLSPMEVRNLLKEEEQK